MADNPDQLLVDPETVGGALVYTWSVALTLMVAVLLITALLLMVLT